MSDRQEGLGWWLASDGKWYPPDRAPAVPPADTWAMPPEGPPVPPPKGGMSSGGKVALVITGVAGTLVLLLAAVFVLGSESEPDGPGPVDEVADVPDGYELLEGVGVTIAVPESWVEIDADDATMTPEDFRAAFPDAPESLLDQGAAAVDRGSVLVAYDVASGLDFDNLNIIEMPVRLPLDVIESQARVELSGVGADVAGFEEVDLPAGDALRAEYTLEVALPEGTLDAVGVQYYVVTDEHTYVVTFTGPGAVDLAARMIETFRAS